jgi:hypothetical protein
VSEHLSLGQVPAVILEPFREIDIPPELETSVGRHRANLARLVSALRMAGVDDHQIEASVDVLVASYRSELLKAIRILIKTCDDD